MRLSLTVSDDQDLWEEFVRNTINFFNNFGPFPLAKSNLIVRHIFSKKDAGLLARNYYFEFPAGIAQIIPTSSR